MRSIEQNIALIVASEFFDSNWYIENYADVAEQGLSAAEHYLRFGAAQLHDPGPRFSTRHYLWQHPDVQAAGVNPLVHYIEFGQAEGRAIVPAGSDVSMSSNAGAISADMERDRQAIEGRQLFDADYYLDANPEVRAAGVDALAHFVEHGAREGRLPNPYFDTCNYRAAYQAPDDPRNSLAHYIVTPGSDGHSTSVLFDGRFYLSRYPDVAGSGMKPLEHYLVVGLAERRQAVFPDVAQAGGAAAVDCRRVRATIIVTVHDAYEQTADCLYSVLKHTALGVSDSLIVIDDASPDPRVRNLLDGLAGLPGIAVVHNASNLGYTRSVNRGCELARGNDVVLLNSDTIVGPNWLRNLKIAAYRGDRTGTVTAVSNNAGAFSVPHAGSNTLPWGNDVDTLARAVADLGNGPAIEVPTGNGFCMYVRRDLINEIGVFDELNFPEGYGEENEFCMRALVSGWTHVVEPATYVYHVRSASFRERRQALAEAGTEKLRQMYPQYGGAIRAIGESRLFGAARYRIAKRFRMLSGGSGRPKPRILYVISTRAGGTPQSNADLMRAVADVYDCYALCCDRTAIEVLRATESGYEVLERYPLSEPVRFATHVSQEYDQILRHVLVRWSVELLHIRHLAWHSLNLVNVAKGLGLPVINSFHDYYSICPTVNLLDREGIYWPTGVAENADNPLWHGDSTIGEMTSGYLRCWQDRMQRTLSGCDAFVTSSHSARDILSQALPGIARRSADFHVVPHGRDFDGWSQSADAGPIRENEPLRILLPGNLRLHKGSTLVEQIKRLDVDGKLQFHLLGTCESELRDHVVDHGTYERGEFGTIVRRIRPHIAAVLSICPETYCHALTECWSCGVPVLGISIGAIGERIEAHRGGWLASPQASPAILYEMLLAIRNSVSDRNRRIGEVQQWQQGVGTQNSTIRMSEQYLALYRSVAIRDRLLANSTIRRTALVLADSDVARFEKNLKTKFEREFGQHVDVVHWSALLRAEGVGYSIVVLQSNKIPGERLYAVIAALREQPGCQMLELSNEMLDSLSREVANSNDDECTGAASMNSLAAGSRFWPSGCAEPQAAQDKTERSA